MSLWFFDRYTAPSFNMTKTSIYSSQWFYSEYQNVSIPYTDDVYTLCAAYQSSSFSCWNYNRLKTCGFNAYIRFYDSVGVTVTTALLGAGSASSADNAAVPGFAYWTGSPKRSITKARLEVYFGTTEVSNFSVSVSSGLVYVARQNTGLGVLSINKTDQNPHVVDIGSSGRKISKIRYEVAQYVEGETDWSASFHGNKIYDLPT